MEESISQFFNDVVPVKKEDNIKTPSRKILKHINIKIGILCEERFQNINKLTRFIYELKKEYGDKLIILSLGEYNMISNSIKKASIDFGIQYQEYNSFCTPFNLYSVFPENFYNKKPFPSDLIVNRVRNIAFISSIDKLYIFTNRACKIYEKTNIELYKLAVKQKKEIYVKNE
jgi:hypothetical protein